ncbi:hypothetical protein WICPIJ_007124 [Wickerhamomyces pijperi]|uniref:Plasma membrane fusion protein PRM1 n=1 Tax=Wickerhamomyces pijperi TaxID=599730 RepID=A0A9P8TK98_WICPI|nr:hypothetical protein WICPIJ_007124 [Wickerhamomyces pijperi]
MIKTPYLTLGDRVSQVWLNKYTIALLLLAIKLLMFQTSLQNSINSAKEYTLNSCPTIDSYASNALSLPHYLSKSANYMIEKSVEEINEKTLETLKMILTASEYMVIFAINMVVGTYACVLVSTVDGAVDVAVNGTETLITYVNDTLGAITDDIEEGLSDVSSVLNHLISAGEKVKDFFTGSSSDSNSTESLSKVNLTVSSLKKLSIPGSINSKLEKLKENVPDFTTVQNKTEALIKEPFELVKNKIASATLFSNDGNDLYVPELKQLTICSANSDKINQFYIDVAKDMKIMVKIFVCLLIVGSVLMTIPIIWEEWRAWRKLKVLEGKVLDMSKMQSEKVQIHEDSQIYPKQEFNSQSQLHRNDMLSTDPIDAFEQTFNKYVTGAGIKCSGLLSSNPQTQLRIRWLFSYILSQRSVILLGLALLGILAVVLQFIILLSFTRAVKNHDLPFEAVTDDLKANFDASINNWTDSTNTYLSGREAEINDDLLGWVKSSTEAVNSTISTIVDDLNEVIAKAFNGTILYAPVKTVVGCVITNKLEKIEDALTWVNEKAQVTLPRVNDVYLLQAFDSSSSSNSSSTDPERYSSKSQTDDTSTGILSKTAEMMSTTESIMKSILETTVKQYKASLRLELWISLSLLGVWFIQLFVALIVIYFDHHLNSGEHSSSSNPVDRNGKYDLSNDKISYPKELAKEHQLKLGYPYKSPFDRTDLQNIQDSKETLSPAMDNKAYQHPWHQYAQTPMMPNRQSPNRGSPPRPVNPFEANPFDDPFDIEPTMNNQSDRYHKDSDQFSVLSNPFEVNDDDLSVLELKNSNEVNELNYKRNIV